MDDELIPVETEKPPKERVKLTHSFWAKVGAVVLLYVFLLGLAICVACFAANVAGWGDAEYVQKYVINELDFTDPSAMTLTRIIWNVSTFCGASAYVGTLCILLALACLIFLFCAAGHRKRETEPRLNQLDRIPLDLYAAAVVGACILLIFVIGDVLRWNMPSGYAAIMQMVFIFAFIGCASFGLVLALLLSFATRVKCGKWWRNTVIYRVLRLIWRAVKAVWHGIGRLGRMIPIVWRTALIMLGLYIIGFILFILMYDESGGWLLVGLLFSIVIYAAAIFGAWQMKGIKKAGQQLAEGNFNEKIDTKHMYWEFKSHAENLNSIGDGLAKEVAQRMKSERLKTELITNVSHDIKTPLTSIIGYAELMLSHPDQPELVLESASCVFREGRRLENISGRLMDQQQVDILCIQPFQRFFHSIRLLIKGRPDFGFQKDFFSCHTRFFHSASNRLLIYISVGRINQLISTLQSTDDGSLRIIRAKQEGSDTHHRHLYAVIQCYIFLLIHTDYLLIILEPPNTADIFM